MSSLETLSMEALADSSGMDVHAIKRYERLGLLIRPRRLPGGLALYPRDNVERICFIARTLDLGFSIATVRQILCSNRKVQLQCDDIYSIAQRRLIEVRSQLADLRRIEQFLAPLVELCPRQGRRESCNIIVALSDRNA